MNMWSDDPREEALFHLGKYPVNGSLLLIGLHTLALITGAIASASGSHAWIPAFTFSSQGLWSQFSLWQIVTYPFVHDPSLWFAIDMLMLYWFGRELENTLGTRAFLVFYGALFLIPPLFFASLTHWFTVILHGSSALHFAIFIAFASLHPQAPMLFNLQARWVAAALLGIVFLQTLANHQWTVLIHYSLSSLLAWQGVRWFQEGTPMERIAEWKADRSEKALAKKIEKETTQLAKKEATIDSILEKIADKGMQSLTPDERTALERARTELIEKDRRSSH